VLSAQVNFINALHFSAGILFISNQTGQNLDRLEAEELMPESFYEVLLLISAFACIMTHLLTKILKYQATGTL
jgi:hypothetical protein